MGVDHDVRYYIGVDLGGTKIGSVLVNERLETVHHVVVPTLADEGPDAVIGRIVQTVRDLAARLPGGIDDVTALAVGSPGPLDKSEGIVIEAPNLGWKNMPVAAMVQQRIGRPVYLESDANAAALAENRLGAGRGTRDMMYMTVSTGIGSGLILDGKLYSGARGAAGEVGHVTMVPDGPMCGCGNRGCLEALASGTAIARRGREAAARPAGKGILAACHGDVSKIDAKLIASLARAGEPMASAILATAFEYLGTAVANAVNLLNVEMVVIGGGVAQIGYPLFEAVTREVRLRAFTFMADDVRIVPALLGTDAGALGAACCAVDRASTSARA